MLRTVWLLDQTCPEIGFPMAGGRASVQAGISYHERFWLPITTEFATFKLAFVGFTFVHGELGLAHQMNFSN
jgi:hypothetical protein